jgi:hypothetical protein
MDTVIDEVVDAVERGITDARTIVAEGRQEITTYVESLPVALQQVGQEAASDIQSRFDELEQSIDARQGELIDSLARRYSEQVQALDSRIEELESEHASFVSRAWNAVKGVIEAIWRLKDLLLNVIARAASAIGDIITNPIGFLGNLVDGVRAGLDNFVSRIWDHLSRALQEWLFGALSGAGLTLPDKLDEMGVLDLVMQVLGMTYQNIRARAVRIVGEDVVARLEQFAEPFVVLIKEGPGGLWDWIKEQLSNLKDRVIGEIQDWVVTKVIKAGIVWIISLLNPAAAFIKACKAIYEIIMFFIERGSQIMEMVNAVIDSIAAIAKGAIGGVATKIENALGRILPVAIGFLASLLNLGGISDKIREIITNLREPVGDAVDWLIEKSVALVRAAGNLLGLGPDTPEAVAADSAPVDGDLRTRVRSELQTTMPDTIDPKRIPTAVNALYAKYQPEGLDAIEVLPDDRHAGVFHVLVTASPTEEEHTLVLAGPEEEYETFREEDMDLAHSVPTVAEGRLTWPGGSAELPGYQSVTGLGHAEALLFEHLRHRWDEILPPADGVERSRVILDLTVTRSTCPGCATELSYMPVWAAQHKQWDLVIRPAFLVLYKGRTTDDPWIDHDGRELRGYEIGIRGLEILRDNGIQPTIVDLDAAVFARLGLEPDSPHAENIRRRNWRLLQAILQVYGTATLRAGR